MANQNVTMLKLKRAFQLLASGMPQREICEELRMGRGVLAKYKKAADACGLSYADAGRLSNEDLEKFLKSTKPALLRIQNKNRIWMNCCPNMFQIWHIIVI